MVNSDHKIFQLVNEFAIKENDQLMSLYGFGIFYMPELAFVYEIGKQMAERRVELFGSEKYQWVRECNYGNGGPTDLSFISTNEKVLYLFEFKLDDKIQKYHNDIKKLATQLDEKYTDFEVKKYFIAIKHLFLSIDDKYSFLDEMNLLFGETATLQQYNSIQTCVNNKDKDVALISMWTID